MRFSLFDAFIKEETPTEFIMDKLPKIEVYRIPEVEHFSQRDNVYDPYINCFPTSTSMGINYCLEIKGLDKTVIGCDPKVQIEDYVNQIMIDSSTTKWMKSNFGRSWWGWRYRRQTIAIVNEYIFNLLMNRHGYKANFTTQLSYDQYCATIFKTKLPIIMSGNFSSVSRIKGHICCGVGFNRIGLEELIVHDPYGSALKSYPKGQSLEENSEDGTYVQYSKKFFIKSKNPELMWGLIISKQ